MIIVVAVRPAQVLKSPAAELFPIEVIQAAMIKERASTRSPPSRCHFRLAAAQLFHRMQFDGPVKLKAGPLTEHTEPAEPQRQPYLQSKDHGPSIYMLDDQTLWRRPSNAAALLIARRRRHRLAGRQSPPPPRATI